MGAGRFDEDDWKTYTTASSYDTKTTKEIFSSRALDASLNPKDVMRESRDSPDNPCSNAIIVGLDVTGSMSRVLDSMARHGLKTLVTEIYDRKPVSDPHVLCAGIGDVEAGDRAPFQPTQFEADIRIAEQLEKIFLEGGGGGNHYESYALTWWFAARHVSTDCFEKRGKKGYLFTIGDELPTPYLRKQDIEKVFGSEAVVGFQGDRVSMDVLLTEVTRKWEVFHLTVEEGSNGGEREKNAWHELLGQRAMVLSDHTKMAEVIVSAIQILEGESKDVVTKSWDGSTSLVVSKATQGLTVGTKSSEVAVAL